LALPADLDGDGVVNFTDLAVLAQNWLDSRQIRRESAKDSGFVDLVTHISFYPGAAFLSLFMAPAAIQLSRLVRVMHRPRMRCMH